VNTLGKTKTPKTEVLINDNKVSVMIDTGVSVKVIDDKTYAMIGRSHILKQENYRGYNLMEV